MLRGLVGALKWVGWDRGRQWETRESPGTLDWKGSNEAKHSRGKARMQTRDVGWKCVSEIPDRDSTYDTYRRVSTSSFVSPLGQSQKLSTHPISLAFKKATQLQFDLLVRLLPADASYLADCLAPDREFSLVFKGMFFDPLMFPELNSPVDLTSMIIAPRSIKLFISFVLLPKPNKSKMPIRLIFYQMYWH